MSFLSIFSSSGLFIGMDIIMSFFHALTFLDIETDTWELVLEGSSADVHVFDSLVVNGHWCREQLRCKFPKLIIDAETGLAIDYFDGYIESVFGIDFLHKIKKVHQFVLVTRPFVWCLPLPWWSELQPFHLC